MYPDFGNEYIANGEGKLIIEDDIFIRSCKCGFEIITDKNGNQIINKRGG
ncbi:DUF3797 domain-containing protein [Fontibacillus panacisegetis]|nr:DUF3797 domain-containing protein [Fontibacillus panacisegetis]